MKEKEKQELLKKLENLRSEIMKILQGKESSIESGIPLDEIDQANEIVEREMGYAMSDNMQKNLKEVENAIAKIKSGGYGICENCHKPIPEKRLKLLPFARFCVSCQQNNEENNR